MGSIKRIKKTVSRELKGTVFLRIKDTVSRELKGQYQDNKDNGMLLPVCKVNIDDADYDHGEGDGQEGEAGAVRQ